MKKAALLGAACVLQAAYGVFSVAVVRLGFRVWPRGSYTWIPGMLAVGSLGVLVAIGWFLGARRVPLLALVAAWYAGRIGGAAASVLVAEGGLDAALFARASFGLLRASEGRIQIGAPDVFPMLTSLAVLAAAWWWAGRRHAGS